MTHAVNLIDTNPDKETYHRLTLTQEGDVTKTVNIIYTLNSNKDPAPTVNLCYTNLNKESTTL